MEGGRKERRKDEKKGREKEEIGIVRRLKGKNK